MENVVDDDDDDDDDDYDDDDDDDDQWSAMHGDSDYSHTSPRTVSTVMNIKMVVDEACDNYSTEYIFEQ